MSELEPCFVVVEAQVPFRYPDGRDSGCCVGYVETDTATVAGLEAVGLCVLLVTRDELAAQILVMERCGMTHGDMLDKKGVFVTHAHEEKTDR